jgi:hypothetical protein
VNKEEGEIKRKKANKTTKKSKNTILTNGKNAGLTIILKKLKQEKRTTRKLQKNQKRRIAINNISYNFSYFLALEEA